MVSSSHTHNRANLSLVGPPFSYTTEALLLWYTTASYCLKYGLLSSVQSSSVQTDLHKQHHRIGKVVAWLWIRSRQIKMNKIWQVEESESLFNTFNKHIHSLPGCFLRAITLIRQLPINQCRAHSNKHLILEEIHLPFLMIPCNIIVYLCLFTFILQNQVIIPQWEQLREPF